MSDSLVLAAAKYVGINGIIARHSNDNTLLSRMLSLDLEKIGDIRMKNNDEYLMRRKEISLIGIDAFLGPNIQKINQAKTNKDCERLERSYETLIEERSFYIRNWRKKMIKKSNSSKSQIVYFLHIEPEMTLNPSSSPLYTHSSIINYIRSKIGCQVLWLKEHPHLKELIKGEYGENYRRYRRYIRKYLKGDVEGVEYLGFSRSNDFLFSNGYTPLSVNGDICIEAGLLGIRSIMVCDWWGFLDRNKLGIDSLASYDRECNNNLAESEESRIKFMADYIENESSFAQTMYLTARTKNKYMDYIERNEEIIAEHLVKIINSYMQGEDQSKLQ